MFFLRRGGGGASSRALVLVEKAKAHFHVQRENGLSKLGKLRRKTVCGCYDGMLRREIRAAVFMKCAGDTDDHLRLRLLKLLTNYAFRANCTGEITRAPCVTFMSLAICHIGVAAQ